MCCILLVVSGVGLYTEIWRVKFRKDRVKMQIWGKPAIFFSWAMSVASFPGPARSSLAVRNSRRGPGLVHHVMSATVVFLRQQITMFAVLPIYMYNGISI